MRTQHDSLDARLFPCVVFAVAPAVTVERASSLLIYSWLLTCVAMPTGQVLRWHLRIIYVEYRYRYI